MSKDAAFEKRALETLLRVKQEPISNTTLLGAGGGKRTVILVPYGRELAQRQELIPLLTRWRRENQHGFAKIFNVTEEGTARWCRSQLIEREDRLLYLVQDAQGRFVAHVGVSSFDFEASTCEVDNIVRGEPQAQKGIMASALVILMDWIYAALRPREIQLRTFNDNSRALALYHRLGFVPFRLDPLHETRDEGIVEWVPAQPDMHYDRFYVAMRHIRPK